MWLTRLHIKGFRSLSNVLIDLNHLTVLIGENDAGKSSVLDMLAICLSNTRPDSTDFYRDEQGQTVEKVLAILDFVLDKDDDEAKPFAIENLLKVRFTFPSDGPLTREYYVEVPIDDKLGQDFSKLNATDQKKLLQELAPNVGADEISNNEKRLEKFSALRDAAPKAPRWLETPPKWGDFLPRFERYSSMDYNAPESMIAKTLRPVYEQTIYERIEVDGKIQRGRLIKPLRDVEDLASQRIREEVKKLEGHIRRYNRHVRGVDYEPEFDFSSSLKLGNFQLDTGRGPHVLAKTGAGTRRRMLMGLLEWDREVSVTQAKAGGKLPSVIRGYDEPDTNLHYEAQRLMYQTIADIVGAESSHVQAILCTHSMTMIDRAPAKSIRLFKLREDGSTDVSYLETDDDCDVERFLDYMAKELGITNSLIFYERCFILIEGETEENALPILYRKQYGRSILEDGIRIINVNGNGAVKEFLKLLSRNRKQMTIVFVDTDTKGQKSAKLTVEVLQVAGFDQDFIRERLLYVGDQEFEDCFADEVIATCLQQHWPKGNGDAWSGNDISQLRNSTKFSEAVRKLVWTCCDEQSPAWNKPVFGQRIAEQCETDCIPTRVRDLFDLARTVAES